MNLIRQALLVPAILMVSSPAFASDGKAAPSYAARYEGGSIGLKQHRSLKAVVSDNEVVFVQGGRRVSVPVQSISEVSCATDVRQRFGASVLGLVPFAALDKAQTHYVGMTWTEEGATGADHKSVDVVFRLNAAEYRHFVAALERLTRRQAVNTKATPTVVRYEN